MKVDRDKLRALIAAKSDQFDEEGDEWLFRPNPDEASLSVDYLTDAILTLLETDRNWAAEPWTPADIVLD